MGCVCTSQKKETKNQRMDNQIIEDKNTEVSMKKKTTSDYFLENVKKEQKEDANIKRERISSSLNESNDENMLSFKSEFVHYTGKSISKLNNESTLNSTPKLNSPLKLTKFAKGQCIYKGELGEIYSGLSLDTGEIIAIKTINIKFDDDNQKKDKLKMLDNLLSLKHKNLINIMSYQEESAHNKIDMIMEFCNGGSIKQLLIKFGVFDEKLIKIYIKQILEGLVFLHENGIIHKNLVSSNILVDGNGVIKINDYLINNILDNCKNETLLKLQTKNYTVLPYWISPELAEMKTELDTSTDIWSIGSLIIEMATNNYPWKDTSKFKTPRELIFYIARSNNPPRIPSHLSKSCKDLLFSCFQRNPRNRPSAKRLLEHDFFKEKLRITTNISTENPHLKLDNNSNIRDTLKSTNILKNHAILKDENCKVNEIRQSTDRSAERVSKHEMVSHVSSVKEEKEKIINFLSDNPENGAFFSISMTVYSMKSNEEKKINIRESQSKHLRENILEEMNEALEHSPVLKDIVIVAGNEKEKKNHFDFTIL